jgi:hypothetical protein
MVVPTTHQRRRLPMRWPRAYSQMTRTIAAHLPHVRRAHCRGLALWVSGTLLAQRACHNAVITALLTHRTWHALRQRLREWLDDGADKADPCHTQGEVTACFAPLLRWVLAWWQGETRALALGATAHGEVVGRWSSVCWIAATPFPSPGRSCLPISRGPGCRSSWRWCRPSSRPCPHR